ncbi:MAG TPA: outer membrane protein transport protein [Holophaga sp.]|nr:outer membrane protein transport protein [Holophaga sp.]
MTKPTRALLSASALALLIVASAPRAQAAGFQLREQGAGAQGQAFAGVAAGSGDLTSMFFNPAVLTRFEGTQLQIGFSNILPSAKFSEGVATRTSIPSAAPFYAISGSTSHQNAAESAVTPTLYAMWSLSKDLKVGVSINVPYGLTTEYDANWIGRYHALRSHLETMDIAPTIAWRVNGQWSVGAAFVARQSKAELSQALDFGYTAYALIRQIQANPAYTVYDPTFSNTNPLTGQPIVYPGAADGSAFIKGDAWAYGFKAGVLYEPSKSLRVGLGYQSGIKPKVKGDVKFNIPPTVAAGLAGLTQVNPGHTATLAYINGVFSANTANGPVTAEVELPACVTFGLNYELSPTFTLSLEADRTMWSKFQELRIKFANPATQPDSYTTENWHDTTFVSVGASCHPGNGWTYRVGAAMDQGAVDDAYRTPRIPDADRVWLSFGVSRQFTKSFAVDFGYSHLFTKTATVNLSGGTPVGPDYFKGNLSGTYKNAIDIWALNARWSF